MHPYKRKKINDEKYLRKLVHCIHHNPVVAGLVTEPERWKHCSYATIISEQETWLEREEVLNWFEDRENFIYCHQLPPELSGIG